jgi:hypothetical protein
MVLDELYSFWRDYFLNTSDYQSHIWTFSEGRTSEFLVGGQDFRLNDASWWITILDPYKGCKPLLLNRDFFLYGHINIAVCPSLLLDSQVVNELHKYVTMLDNMTDPRRKAVRDFIAFIVSRNLDFSPIFYFLEMMAKSEPETRGLYAEERARTVLALQTMDMQHFMNTGRVVPDSDVQAAQLAYQGIDSIEELIARNTDVVFECPTPFFSSIVDFMYASLLKIALVQRQQMRADVRTKYFVIYEFMEQTLGIILEAELDVALGYFVHPQRYQRFIRPLQREMNFTTFRHNLRASAWDLLLVRLPESLLDLNILGLSVIAYPCNLSYVCTAENALRDIMASRRVKTVFSLRPELGKMPTLVERDMEAFSTALGNDVIYDIMLETNARQARKYRDPVTTGGISPDALANVISGLEAEAASFCKPGT